MKNPLHPTHTAAGRLRHTAVIASFALLLAAPAWSDDTQRRYALTQEQQAKAGIKNSPLKEQVPPPDDPYDLRRKDTFTDDKKPKISNLIGHKFDDAEFRIRLKMASRALDEWAKRVEEYGSITMSSPILTREQDTFKFDIKDGAQEFFQNAKARKDGSAAATLAIVNQFSLAGEANIDPLARDQIATSLTNYNIKQREYQDQMQANNDARLAQQKAALLTRDSELATAAQAPTPAERASKESAAYKKYSDSITTTSPTPPTYPADVSSSGVNNPDATKGMTNQAQLNLDSADGTSTNFLKSIGGLTNGTPLAQLSLPGGLPDRVAMIDAAGTNTVKAIFQILGKPEEAMKFKDKRVLFATVDVGVNPGWRTRTDFSAEITGQASYRLVRARTDVVWELRDRLGNAEWTAALLKNHGLEDEWRQLPEAEKKKYAPASPIKRKQIEEAEKAKAKAQADADRAKAVVVQQTQQEEEEGQKEKYYKENLLKPKLQEVGELAKVVADKEDEFRKVFSDKDRANARRWRMPPTLDGKSADPKTSVAPELTEAAISGDIAAFKDWSGVSKKAMNASNTDSYKASIEELKKMVTRYWAIRNAQYAVPGPNGELLIPPKYREEMEKAIEHLTTLSQYSADKEEASKAKEKAAGELESSENEVKTQERQLASLTASGTGGAFGSGEGGGDLGNLKLHNDYYNKVTATMQPPLVAGISPLMESQVLDLKDSYGRQDQVAIALAVALRKGGMKGSAQLFDRFMRQQTKTAATNSALPVVNTFSASGGLFGFQVGPRLRALNDPAARKGGSANVLDRQSFPAVLIVGFDRADLSPVICRDYDGKFYVFEPELSVKQSSRWNPLDRKLFSFSKNDWWNPLDWHNPRYSERDRTDNLINVADQFRDLDEWLRLENKHAFQTQNPNCGVASGDPTIMGASGKGPVDDCDGFARHPYVEAVQSLIRQRDALKELFIGSECRQYLPQSVILAAKPDPTAASEPQVTELVPASLTIPLPTGLGSGNAPQIAQLKGAFNDQQTQYITARDPARAAVKATHDGIVAQLATSKVVSDLVAKTLPAPEAGKTAPPLLRTHRRMP